MTSELKKYAVEKLHWSTAGHDYYFHEWYNLWKDQVSEGKRKCFCKIKAKRCIGLSRTMRRAVPFLWEYQPGSVSSSIGSRRMLVVRSVETILKMLLVHDSQSSVVEKNSSLKWSFAPSLRVDGFFLSQFTGR